MPNGPKPDPEACKTVVPDPTRCPVKGVTRKDNLDRAKKCIQLCPEQGKKDFSDIAKYCEYKKSFDACKAKKTPIKNGPVPDPKACDPPPPPPPEDPDKCPKEGVTRKTNLERAVKCQPLCPEQGKKDFKDIAKDCKYKKAFDACKAKKKPISNGPIPDEKACDPIPPPPVVKDDCPKDGVTRERNLARSFACKKLCMEKGKPGGPLVKFDSIASDCQYKKNYDNCQKKKTPISNGPVPNEDACKKTPPGPPTDNKTDDKGCPSTGVTRS